MRRNLECLSGDERVRIRSDRAPVCLIDHLPQLGVAILLQGDAPQRVAGLYDVLARSRGRLRRRAGDHTGGTGEGDGGGDGDSTGLKAGAEPDVGTTMASGPRSFSTGPISGPPCRLPGDRPIPPPAIATSTIRRTSQTLK